MLNNLLNIEQFIDEIDIPLLINYPEKDKFQSNEKLKKLLNTTSELNFEYWNNQKFYDVNNNLLTFDKLPFVVAGKERKSIPFFRLKYITKEFSEKYLFVSSLFIPQENKDSIVITIFADTTKETEIEQILKESLRNIQVVIYSTNADGTEYYFITEAVRQLFGFTPEEIYQHKFLILRTIEKDHFKKFKEFIERLRKGEASTVEYKMKDRFGKEHWVRHHGIPIIRNNKIVRIDGIILDITEEKIFQLRLENSEEKFRMLIDTADDLIFILNGFGYFSMVNKNGAYVLGFKQEEILGKHFLDLIDKEDEQKIADAFSKVLRSNQKVVFEVNFLDKFEKPITFEVHAKPMMVDGEVFGMIGIGRNITARKQYELKIKELNSKLIEANRIISIERERARQKISLLEELSKLKSEFISNISHELRTPLASVVGFAETIATDTDLPKETIKEFSEIILSEGKRLAKLIDEVLDFSKLESGQEELKKEEFIICDVVNEVTDEFEKEIAKKNLVLTKELSSKEVKIFADRKRIKQVLINLLSNAIKYTPDGGRITIIVNDFEREVELTVSDTGIGIPEKELPKLFQKFSKIYRPNAPVGGAGFGLALVKQIVDLHKGIIRVMSEENKGTTFIIRLPK
ncbi:MAG: PAS domain-containing sensor histidine kinase [Melioribacter sp.]|nr:PAS domain-containing sensor histidine kinase [Melioribacter sp.]